MLHFGTLTSGTTSVWGTRLREDSQEPEVEFRASLANIPMRALGLKGQYLGGIGMYRSASGQPIIVYADGSFQLNAYALTYAYADGSYPLALQTFLALTDGMTAHGAIADPNKNVYAVLADGLTLHETTPVFTKIGFVALVQAMTVHDAITFNVKMNVSLVEDVLLNDALLTNLALLSYVINANTFAVTKYNNFNFNSFAYLNGTYYGMNDDGIYEMVGDNDNGTAIAASVTLGKTDFKSKQLKTVQSAYVGMHASGDMILKVVSDEGTANYYTITAQTSGDLKTVRTIFGRGIKSRYWQVTLTNTLGCDFAVDSINFTAVELSRRIGNMP